MRILDKARLQLRSLCRRPNVDFELEAELRFHLDQLIEEKISSGMPPEEARRAAHRMIGGIAQYKEECRDMRRVNFVEDLVQDVRFERNGLEDQQIKSALDKIGWLCHMPRLPTIVDDQSNIVAQASL
jgi:hypothetical protein